MKNPTKEEIGNARREAGITQAEAANLCCATRGAYQHWEYGRRRMPPAYWELFLIKLERLKNER